MPRHSAAQLVRDFDPVTLRLFVAVCEERNIARAAAREALVASAVSKRIAAIEAAVGTPLLVRARRGIQPTAAGEALLRHSRELLAAMERMRAELDEFAGGVQGSVRVMASVSALAEQLPEDIAGFLAEHAAVRVNLEERVSAAIVRGVREGAADLGVLWDYADLQGLATEPYRRDQLWVALPRGHRFARRRQLHFVETLDEPSVGVAPAGLMTVLLRRQAALLGRRLVHRIEVSSLDAACRIVAAGLGHAVLPAEATAPWVSAQALVLVPLADDWAWRQFVVCSRADGSLSPVARLLVRHLVVRAAATTAASPARSASRRGG